MGLGFEGPLQRGWILVYNLSLDSGYNGAWFTVKVCTSGHAS